MQSVMRIRYLIERRRRDRFIAWGVSPKWWAKPNLGALKGRQISAAA